LIFLKSAVTLLDGRILFWCRKRIIVATGEHDDSRQTDDEFAHFIFLIPFFDEGILNSAQRQNCAPHHTQQLAKVVFGRFYQSNNGGSATGGDLQVAILVVLEPFK
jgi:hypothetical protein